MPKKRPRTLCAPYRVIAFSAMSGGREKYLSSYFGGVEWQYQFMQLGPQMQKLLHSIRKETHHDAQTFKEVFCEITGTEVGITKWFDQHVPITGVLAEKFSQLIDRANRGNIRSANKVRSMYSHRFGGEEVDSRIPLRNTVYQTKAEKIELMKSISRIKFTRDVYRRILLETKSMDIHELDIDGRCGLWTWDTNESSHLGNAMGKLLMELRTEI